MTTPPAKTETAAKKDVTKLQRAIVDGLEDVKAQDIQVFNTEHLSPLFERVIVATGSSNRQTKALAASVRDAVREAGFVKPRTEGEENGEWIIVDCGQAVVHVMQPAIRQYYRLEEIWGDKPVRLKLGSTKPRIAQASQEKPAPAKKAAAKKIVAKKAAPKAEKSQTAEKPKAKSVVKSVVKSVTKKPRSTSTPVQTLVVNPPSTKKAAVKRAAAKNTSDKSAKPAKPTKPVKAEKPASVKKVAPKKATPKNTDKN